MRERDRDMRERNRDRNFCEGEDCNCTSADEYYNANCLVSLSFEFARAQYGDDWRLAS